MRNGITIHRATAAFTVGGTSYPAGSFIVKTAQAFRPHVLDMFEPQDHPNDVRYPGGPPIPPYDAAGWTLAYQMGITFDRILDGFDGPFERLNGLVTPPAGTVTETNGTTGYMFSHAQNDAFVAVNRLVKNGDQVYWLSPEHMYVAARPQTMAVLKKAATDLGITFTATKSPPNEHAIRLRPVRIGLVDFYGGSSESGWLRWLFEQYEFPFDVVYAPKLDEGNLHERYDVLIFPGYSIPDRDRTEEESTRYTEYWASVPPEYRDRIGFVTIAKTVPQLQTFLQQGGTILALGRSAVLASHLKLPISNALVEQTPTGPRPLSNDKVFIPGSILQMNVDNTHPLAYGLPSKVDAFVYQSPVFRLAPDAGLKGVRAVAWYANSGPLLRSGWAWGEQYLHGGVAVAEASVGKGHLLLFGPEITFRGQPHGTFKFLFNGIYWGPVASEGRTSAVSTSTR
jgi:hypothetical protein